MRSALLSLRPCTSRAASSSQKGETPSNPQSRKDTISRPPSSSLIQTACSPKVFKYKDSLVRNLHESLILHEPGRFVILQKPYGVSCLGFKQKGGGVFQNSVHNAMDREEESEEREYIEPLDKPVTVADCIPQLSKLLREPHLGFCSGLKRYLSGPLILPCNVKEYNNMMASLRRSLGVKSERETFYLHSALVIVVGTPEKEEGELRGYATFQPVGHHKEYIFVEGSTTKRAKTGKYAVEGEIAWRTLVSGHGCSLLHVQCSKFSRHLPRLALTHINTPVLGDSLYCKRFFDVDGVAVKMDPAKAARNKGKKFIPRELVDLLGRSSMESLPIYFHVWQTVLPRYGGGSADLVASAPPPVHFSAMVDLLGFKSALKRFWNEQVEAADDE